MQDKKNDSQILTSAKKFLEDKKMVSAYLRGEVTKEALDDKGIKLAMPL
ncbi:hypothetical protein [Flavobacterium psychrotrophum]|nr:hypothetical protein [Flavobacterium psychrotrophum]